MPFVLNGIGTWYYGKGRIHTLQGTCEFCGCQTELESYDTTLFFVVFFVPVIPLAQKRILQQCSGCQKHRVISRAKWEEIKVNEGAALLEKIRHDPNDRDAIMQIIGFAVAYQDEPLFNTIVETLVDKPTGDAAIQAQLGDAYAYFARWPLAEQSYRGSLAVEDNEVIREQLAWSLLKQGRPDEARPYLQHVLDRKKDNAAGMIYALIEGYQAQGRHEEALEIIDLRDEAFPQWVTSKEYRQQRKLSTRYRGTEKKIRSAVLAPGKAGYREGSRWSTRFPYAVAALVLLGALFLYLGSAFWIGQARKVFLVNGTSQAYTVVVQGVDHTIPAYCARPIHIAEGDVQVAFRDAKLALEPVQARIETNFWSRPFAGHTFVINPDQSAVVMEEEAYYAVANPREGKPITIHIGQAFYSMPGFDYEFENFPATLKVKGTSEVRKTRVGLAPQLAPELRLSLVQGLEPQDQIKFCQRLLRIDPKATLFLHLLYSRLSPQEALKFVETRLDDRPILVEWHRFYQTLMERMHPETDLRPRYRKLLADSEGQADALYLLGRADPDLDESDKLYRQATAAKPPSAYANYALGYRALSEARFAEAIRWFEKALPLMTDKTLLEQTYQEALLAHGDYDQLLKILQKDAQVPGRNAWATIQMMRVYAVRGDKVKARQKLAEIVRTSPTEGQKTLQKSLESILCCCEKNVDGYLKATDAASSFEAALLRGQLKQAADLVTSNSSNATACHGLLYLKATRSGAKELAKTHWEALLGNLNQGGREEKYFGEILAGRKSLASNLPQRLPVEPTNKRVLLAVLAQRYPDQAKDLLTLAKRLDYHHDAISLCLGQFLK